jgi:hypothetical protein
MVPDPGEQLFFTLDKRLTVHRQRVQAHDPSRVVQVAAAHIHGGDT